MSWWPGQPSRWSLLQSHHCMFYVNICQNILNANCLLWWFTVGHLWTLCTLYVAFPSHLYCPHTIHAKDRPQTNICLINKCMKKLHDPVVTKKKKVCLGYICRKHASKWFRRTLKIYSQHSPIFNHRLSVSIQHVVCKNTTKTENSQERPAFSGIK